MDDTPRSRSARLAAESALVRVVHHYGSTPEFVVLGGLVPELLCAGGSFHHAGTTDVDVQVNLEIFGGATNVVRLEEALRNAEFQPEGGRSWRWVGPYPRDPRTIVRFELLADLDDQPAGDLTFDSTTALGAANLRGTAFAACDVEVRTLCARVGDQWVTVDVRTTGLAGFLLAKTAAARARHIPKDWYDIAFVLLHNDAGGPGQAAGRVRDLFAGDLVSLATAFDDLAANTADVAAPGARAYAEQFCEDHPEADRSTAAADAVTAVTLFLEALRGP